MVVIAVVVVLVDVVVMLVVVLVDVLVVLPKLTWGKKFLKPAAPQGSRFPLLHLTRRLCAEKIKQI